MGDFMIEKIFRFGLVSFFGWEIFLQFLLHKFRKSTETFRSSQKPLESYPPVSVIIPIKGPAAHIKPVLRSFIENGYPSELEIVLAFQDCNDPSLADAQEISKNLPSGVTFKILDGCERIGLNPKNSNLVHALRAACHEWIYSTDIDTRVEAHHLESCFRLQKGDRNTFVTAMTVHEGPKSFWAALESIGANREIVTFFLIMSLKKSLDVLNGAALLAHKSLFERVGGLEIALNTLTEDLFLANHFSRVGAKGYLVPAFVRVVQEFESRSQYVSRQVRWIKISQCFRADLFWGAPPYWFGQWALLFAAVTGNSHLALIGGVALLLRAFGTYVFQWQLKVPAPDRAKAFVLIFCDLFAPIAWFKALFTKQVSWAGTPLRILPDGHLEKATNPRK